MKNEAKTIQREQKTVSWYPSAIQLEKLKKLQKKLIIESRSGVINKSVGELFEKNFPGESWM